MFSIVPSPTQNYTISGAVNEASSAVKLITQAGLEGVASGGIFAIDFYVEFEDGNSTWYYDSLRFSDGTHDWENTESTVTFSKGVKRITPYCLLYSVTGTSWFDDIYANRK